MLELSMNMGGREMIIHPTLLWDEDNVILVDAGLLGGLQAINDEINKASVTFNKLNKVIIIHQDMDHIGSLYDIVHKSVHKINVLAHEDDKPYIQGDKRLNKMTTERKGATSSTNKNHA
jgi:glyoxylase-like metal-dependent hydrolase (beta-lactamase superfamily II)